MSRLCTKHKYFPSTLWSSRSKNVTTCYKNAYRKLNFYSLYDSEFLELRKSSFFIWPVPVLADQFSYYILPAHQPVELLHAVYSNRLWTEWKYKCNCTATATVCCSYSCTDTALGEFLHLQSELQLQTHLLF